MVHNGIEYADMQFIAEAYDLLRGAGLETWHIADVFAEWNSGDLDSFLIETTAEVLRQVDAARARPGRRHRRPGRAEGHGGGPCRSRSSWASPSTRSRSRLRPVDVGHTDLRTAAAGNPHRAGRPVGGGRDHCVDDVRAAL